MGAGVRDAFPPPMCVVVLSICVWKRRCADVRAGTQAPPLRILLGWIARGQLMSFGQIACKWYFVCVGLRGKI